MAQEIKPAKAVHWMTFFHVCFVDFVHVAIEFREIQWFIAACFHKSGHLTHLSKNIIMTPSTFLLFIKMLQQKASCDRLSTTLYFILIIDLTIFTVILQSYIMFFFLKKY